MHTFFHRARKNTFPRRKLMCLDSLERGRSLLFCAPKIIKIEWLTRKWWCQIYREWKSSIRFCIFYFFMEFPFSHWFPLISHWIHYVSFGFPKKLIENWASVAKLRQAYRICVERSKSYLWSARGSEAKGSASHHVERSEIQRTEAE